MYDAKHTYVYTSIRMYIRTYVLRPNSPTHTMYYVLAAVFASCFYVLFKICFTRGGTQGPPVVTSLKNVFFIFFKAITLYFCVLFKFCFMREDAQGSPLVTSLKNVFFIFFKAITLYFCVLFKNFASRERVPKAPPLYCF